MPPTPNRHTYTHFWSFHLECKGLHDKSQWYSKLIVKIYVMYFLLVLTNYGRISQSADLQLMKNYAGIWKWTWVKIFSKLGSPNLICIQKWVLEEGQSTWQFHGYTTIANNYSWCWMDGGYITIGVILRPKWWLLLLAAQDQTYYYNSGYRNVYCN